MATTTSLPVTIPPPTYTRFMRPIPLSPLNPNRFGTRPDDNGMGSDHAEDTTIAPCRSSSPPSPTSSPTPSLWNNASAGPSRTPAHLVSPTAGAGPRRSHSSTPFSFASSHRAQLPRSGSSTSTTRLTRPPQRWQTTTTASTPSPSSAYRRTYDALMGGEQRNTVEGAMWRDKFRQRCMRRQEARRRSGGMQRSASDGEVPGSSEGDYDDEEAAREDEEIFRRIVSHQRRTAIQKAQRSYDAEVGGSDPAVWESSLREAEAQDVDSVEVEAMEEEILRMMREEEEEEAMRGQEQEFGSELFEGIDPESLWEQFDDMDVDMES